MMDTALFHGELVRLVAPDPDNESDMETQARWWRDSEFQRLLDTDPAMLHTAKSMKEELEKELVKEDGFFFFIRRLSDDRLLGFIGLHSNVFTHGNMWVGVGIGDRENWGKGYGTDAMRVLLRYAFTELNLHRVTLIVFEQNKRAIRSYEKAGFVVEGVTRKEYTREGRRWDVVHMGVLREDWLRQNRE
jgi:RimJ/RimL family protein N-acetyltransferase